MRRFLLAIAFMAVMFSSFAIDLTKACDKLAAIPGALQPEIPAEELKKENIDKGRVVMINEATEDARKVFNSVINDIDGEVFLDTKKDDVSIKIFTADVGEGKIRLLMAVDAGKNIVAFYGEGDKKMLDDIKLPK